MDHVVRAFQAKLPHRLRLLPTVIARQPHPLGDGGDCVIRTAGLNDLDRVRDHRRRRSGLCESPWVSNLVITENEFLALEN